MALEYLPEKNTDFVFSIVEFQWGEWLAALLIVSVIFLVTFYLLRRKNRQKIKQREQQP